MPSKTQPKKPAPSQSDRGRSRTPAKEIQKQEPVGDPKPDPRTEVID